VRRNKLILSSVQEKASNKLTFVHGALWVLKAPLLPVSARSKQEVSSGFISWLSLYICILVIAVYRKLEHQMQAQQLKLREEKRIVAEIDTLKRSKRNLK